MSKYTIRATTIVGTHVENWEGENLGLISDIMLNKADGDVAYLVLSYPGLYGQQYPDKRFAVPFESIAMKTSVSNVDYIMDVDEEFLKKAPGFDNNDWPDFADPTFNALLKDYYKDVSVDIRV